MTTVYEDYYSAYQNGLFDISNVNFNCKLVTDEYIPDSLHKPQDITNYIITSVSALKGEIISTKSMHEIVEHLKEKMQKGLILSRDLIREQIDTVISDEEKRNKVKEIIDRLNVENTDNIYDIWRELNENGVKYLVIESPSLNILCFCEEVY